MALSAEARRWLRRVKKDLVTRMPKRVYDEIRAAGLPLQREHPLNEPPMFYKLTRDDSFGAADWVPTAEDCRTSAKMGHISGLK